MFVGLLVIVHHLMYVSSTVMQVIMYKYLRNKPPGLQSVLDLLLMDLLRVQMFNYTFFIIFLLCGYFHGHLPYDISQVMIFLSLNVNVCLLGLFQFFLVTKAVMIFRRPWLDEVSDSWVIGFSRSFALMYTFIRFMGDFLTRKVRPGPMTRFLTGTDAET